MEKGIEIVSLPCPMTPEEHRLKGIALANANQEKARIEAEKKLANEGFKERLSAIDSRIGELRHEVISGCEHRPTEVREVRRYQTHMVDTIRLDTGETIRSRPMTVSERQEVLEFDGGALPGEH